LTNQSKKWFRFLSIPVIADAHNDLLLELVLRRAEQNPFAAHWLPQLRAGDVGLQVCALYAADAAPDEARSVAEAQLEAFSRLLDENADQVVQVRSRDDLRRIGDGRIGLLLSMEGVEALGGQPTAFGDFWDAGVRLVGLTHNPPNAFAGGIDAAGQGLTDRGRALVDELADRGAIIDLAHASERTFFERAPMADVMVSHACCRAVHDVPRNLSDEQLSALAERDGFLGLMALALTVGPPASIDRLVDHCDHAVSLMGERRVGLGADVIDQVVAAEEELGIELQQAVVDARAAGDGRLGLSDLTGPEDFPALAAALRSRGYEGEGLESLLSGNLVRLLERALPQSLGRE
jgi:membrane dipeptidase